MKYDFDGVEIKDSVYGIYLDIQHDIMINVASRFSDIENWQDVPYTDRWKIDKMVQLRDVTDTNIEIFAKKEVKVDENLRKELQHLQDEMMKKDIKMLKGTVPNRKSDPLKNIIDVQVSDFKVSKNLTRITALEFANNAYLDIINKTAIDVELSTKTHYEALRDAVKEFSQTGLQTLTYSSQSGKFSTISLDAGIKRAVNTRLTQTMAKTQFQKMDDWELDLLEVSAHMGARPNCAPFQGLVYSRSGKSMKYPAWSSSSYGDIDGLLGINCTHTIYPFVEGISERTFTPFDPVENAKVYEESQMQRDFERIIRTTKREISTLQAAGFDTSFEQNKLNNTYTAIRQFVKVTGRTRNYDNERIYS